MKKALVIVVLLALVVVAGALWARPSKEVATYVTFDECAAAFGVVEGTVVRRCTMPDGAVFFAVPDEARPESHTDEVSIDGLVAGQRITSPLTLQGKARLWYFEASFPVFVIDPDGNVLGQHFVTAQGEWMTSDFVPFAGEIAFAAEEVSFGGVVFAKDNPSGLPALDKRVIIPVLFQ